MTDDDRNGLSVALVSLFKGVIHRDDDPQKWQLLQRFEARIRDHVNLLGLSLVIHDDEGFAFLQSREPEEDEPELPRLVPRRQLSYPVSLTLALLRRRLAEHDSFNPEPRLILDVDEVVEMVRTFLPEGTTEARTVDQVHSHLRRVKELGFIRFLSREENKIEVKRILKAFVDAQWLDEFDRRLEEYAEYAGVAEADAAGVDDSAAGDAGDSAAADAEYSAAAGVGDSAAAGADSGEEEDN